MEWAQRLRCGLLSSVIVCAGLAAWTAPAQQPPNAKKERPWKPVVVAAPVLRFGAHLEESASAALKDWIGGHIQKNLREKPIDPKVTIDAVDARFPSASDVARDAGIYLTFFLAYHDDTENERVLSFRIREIDRLVDEETRTMAKEWQREQNLAAAGRPVSAAAMEQRQEADRKANERLRDLRDERETKLVQLQFTRKKIDVYLKLLERAYQKLKDTDPAILRELN